MHYILITLVLSFGGDCYRGIYYIQTGEKTEKCQSTELKTKYEIYEDKKELAKDLKYCNVDRECDIVAVIGCNLKGCKEYEYSLSTEPEIKETVKLTEK